LDIRVNEISDEQLNDLADKITERLSTKQKEELVELKSYTFHNTRLLLRNYKKLKAHVVNVENRLLEDSETFWNHKTLSLGFLMQNRAKTVKIMHHVDDCLEEYERLCKETGERGYDLLKMKYFNTFMSEEMIADRYGVSRQAINNQIKEAINDFSVILYGVDALEDL